jgi:hypothetical protein
MAIYSNLLIWEQLHQELTDKAVKSLTQQLLVCSKAGGGLFIAIIIATGV